MMKIYSISINSSFTVFSYTDTSMMNVTVRQLTSVSMGADSNTLTVYSGLSNTGGLSFTSWTSTSKVRLADSGGFPPS